MATHWIVVIISVMFLIAAQEFGGTVMMKISIKLVMYQNGFILERVTKKLKETIDVRLKNFIIFCLYQNNPSETIQFYLFSIIHNHVQNKSYEKSN